jgi:hypothetical protein
MSIGFQSFLEGFTQSGLFGGAKMPGGEVLVEETTNLEESQFRDLLMPFLISKDDAVEIGQAEAIASHENDMYSTISAPHCGQKARG